MRELFAYRQNLTNTHSGSNWHLNATVLYTRLWCVFIMEINLEYRKDFYSSDEEMIKILKYDRMKELERKRFDAEQEYKNKIKDIEQEFNIEMNDHKHKYKVSFDAPPYDYGKVCTICGYTMY